MEYAHGSVGIDGNVRDLMHQVVVSGTLANNSEVVNERLISLSVLERSFKAGILRHSRRLILITGGFAGTRKTLRLKMSRPTNVVAVDTKCDQRVQGAA